MCQSIHVLLLRRVGKFNSSLRLKLVSINDLLNLHKLNIKLNKVKLFHTLKCLIFIYSRITFFYYLRLCRTCSHQNSELNPVTPRAYQAIGRVMGTLSHTSATQIADRRATCCGSRLPEAFRHDKAGTR